MGSQEGQKLYFRPKQQVAFTAPQNYTFLFCIERPDFKIWWPPELEDNAKGESLLNEAQVSV